jgi:stress-induced morphogen
MTRQQANNLAKALKKSFGGKVDFESVNGNGRYRFSITSKRFEKKTQLQRQDAIWKVVDEVLPRDATLAVSIILAYAPTDLLAMK